MNTPDPGRPKHVHLRRGRGKAAQPIITAEQLLASVEALTGVLSKLEADRREIVRQFRAATAPDRAATVAARQARTQEIRDAGEGALLDGERPTLALHPDPMALRGLGSAIVLCAVKDARRHLSNDPRDTTQAEARAWLMGRPLERCLEAFGVPMDPDSIRSRLRFS